jgi:hypothetical protein
MSPGNPSSAFAIPAINATYSTVRIAGKNQTNITNNFYVDRNYDSGNWKSSQTHLELIDISDMVYEWLSAVIPSANYDGALKARLKDTGKWFIDGARFARWKSQADDLLWISGTRTFPAIIESTLDFDLLR